ncbi:GNAT family N-acetyltransferase [Pararhizobium antarcticum]|uniref:Acetyltransferase n=1 Tax=Pararhizobium antarcticum TaxID=1798805 RepID=A0A657LYC1_9HYPH|nr:GNAT family N-acetyltransferase [Pararhizobium antarcticum]OJG00261.1 acetyltransferase [Pararhizobium antarcticum]OJG00892.1 acetyltransferase [Rhizobium sp. 58]
MIFVRTAREVEVQLLSAIGLRAWEQAVFGLADVERMRRVAELAFLSFLRSHWAVTSVIESGGTPVGWGACEDQDGAISDLWIDPVVQGAGMGSRLLLHVEAEIVRAGFDDATTKTHAQNARAIGFFRKHGYSVNWLSTTYSAKLDRDVESIGLTKRLVADEPPGYGPGMGV